MLAVVAALCTAFATPPAVLTHHPVLRAQPRRQGIVPQVVDPACQLLHSPDSACAHAAVVARAQCRVQMMAGQPSAAERVFATLPYFLPFVDGFSYGIYVFNNVPGGVEFASLVLPLVIAFNSLPFAGIVTFIGLSLFTRSSSGLPRFVRFNIQQALILDILLIIPSVFSSLPGSENLPSFITIAGSNFVFYVMALVVSYALVSNAQGKLPDQVPVISEAAALQIGPS
mmetsp:Transcript_24490/g.79041  ORF Transcript_24490/g.79041 Transcript_24490/m.79041 type:complete len:228 (+) Transcript_24490:2044-2727(+)